MKNNISSIRDQLILRAAGFNFIPFFKIKKTNTFNLKDPEAPDRTGGGGRPAAGTGLALGILGGDAAL